MTFNARQFERLPINERNQTVFWKNPWPPLPSTDAQALAMQMKATTGLGKTSAFLKILSDSEHLREQEIRFYTPDHAQATEVAQRAIALGIRTKLILGRTGEEQSAGYCARSVVADQAAKAGLSVYQTCCQRRGASNDGAKQLCPHFENCPYLNQWHDDRPALRILVNNYVFLPEQTWDDLSLPRPYFAVVDESILNKATQEFTFSLDRLEEPFRSAVQDVFDGKLDFRTALTQRNVDDKWAWDTAERLDPLSNGDVTPSMKDNRALSKIEKIKAAEHQKLTAFYRAVAQEHRFDRPIYGISFHKDEAVYANGQPERQNRVHVHVRKECKIPNSVPLLVLDADADKDLNELIFGRKLEAHEINAETNAHLTQVSSTTMANSTMLGRLPKKAPEIKTPLQKADKIVAEVVAKHKKVLVVLPKQAETALVAFGFLKRDTRGAYWHGADVTHFGALRGQDKWKDHDAIVVIGRNQPPVTAVEHFMRALYSQQDMELEFAEEAGLKKEWRGYRMASGMLVGVETPVHPDPRGQRILEQIREAETTQAIGRLRLVHCDEIKTVILLCKLPLDVTVDRLTSLDGLAGTPGRQGPIERLIEILNEHGMLPLGGRDLHQAHPKKFPSESSARDALKAARKQCVEALRTPPEASEVHLLGNHAQQTKHVPRINGGELLREYLLGFAPHFRTALYRPGRQRGRASFAVFDVHPHPTPQSSLANLIGKEIESFTPLQRQTPTK